MISKNTETIKSPLWDFSKTKSKTFVLCILYAEMQENFQSGISIFPYTKSISYNKQYIKIIQHSQERSSPFTQSLSNQHFEISLPAEHTGILPGSWITMLIVPNISSHLMGAIGA